mgnify:CR=1 FL=1
MQKAIIVGCSGQDGTLLFDLLASKGYALLGIARTSIRTHGCTWTTDIDISKHDDVSRVIQAYQPNEVYYLAAHHHTSEDDLNNDYELFRCSFDVNFHYLVNFLDAIHLYSPHSKLFYAASSHVFGEPESECQDESTPIAPVCVYGISKTAGLCACRYYRNTKSIFASVGILYNHESSLRDEGFISQKIIRGAIRINNGRQDKLVIGNLQAVVDWGYAPDYVEAMHRILQHGKVDDFVISTGTKHTVQEFVEITFGLLGIDWRKYVVTDASLLKKTKRVLIGNPEKLYRTTGWHAKTGLAEMISLMLNEQLAVSS